MHPPRASVAGDLAVERVNSLGNTIAFKAQD